MQTTDLAILNKKYIDEIKPKLKKELGVKNIFEVPKIEKIIINCRLGPILEEKKAWEIVVANIAKITGQKPVPTKAKKAIASFKIRKNQVIGYKVTLRG